MIEIQPGVLYGKGQPPEGYTSNGQGFHHLELTECPHRKIKLTQTDCCLSDKIHCAHFEKRVRFKTCVQCTVTVTENKFK